MPGQEQIFCCFTIDGDQFLGELNLNGDETNLRLNSRRQIPYSPEPHSLFGESLDHKKISLFQCVGNSPSPEGVYPKFVFKRDTFPHYTLIGNKHYTERDEVFKAVSFQADDLEIVFAKSGTFGATPVDPEKLQEILDYTSPARKITIGASPVIFYFSGDQNIPAADIGIGMFSANVEFNSKISDHSGISCPSKITAKLDFKTAKTLDGVRDAVSSILHFLAVIAGRPQGVENITVSTSDTSQSQPAKAEEETSVCWSLSPHSSKVLPSRLRDMPITPNRDAEQFFRIFANWLDRYEEWMLARL
jgi:hypothetical protein